MVWPNSTKVEPAVSTDVTGPTNSLAQRTRRARPTPRSRSTSDPSISTHMPIFRSERRPPASSSSTTTATLSSKRTPLTTIEP